MIYITSKRHLFRRCGVAHPKERIGYPDGKFSADQLAVLQAEPMLTVEIVPDAEAKTEAKPEAKTKAKGK